MTKTNTNTNNKHVSDNLQRKHDDKKLLERLEFEQLISDLSARFVNISPDKMDGEIGRSLKLIYEFFGCDRCALLEGFPDKTRWRITHVAARENLPPVPTGMIFPAAASPWIFEKLVQKREIVAISKLDDSPADADLPQLLVPHVKLGFSLFSIFNSGAPLVLEADNSMNYVA